MPKRGAKQSNRGGGRGGHSKPHGQSTRGSGRGGGRGGGGGGRGRGQSNRDYDDLLDADFIPFSGSGFGNQHGHSHRQRSTEEDIYRRIQLAKGGRGGRSAGESTRQYGYRPPPPKQNANGKNSKHVFWPHPDSYGQQSTNVPWSKARNQPVQVMFNRATSLTDPAMQHRQDDSDDDSEDDSSDDLMDRGIDSDDESDEEYLMQQFNWIEEEQDLVQRKLTVEHVQQTTDSVQITNGSGSKFTTVVETTSVQSTEPSEVDLAEVDIDEIANLSRPLSALSSTSLRSVAHKDKKPKVDSVSASSSPSHPQAAKDESALWVIDTTPDVLVAEMQDTFISLPPEPAPADKPKKKAHRSKRGGRNQKDKQIARQLVVGHDDDGLIYLEESEDEEEDDDILALQDYLENTMDPDNPDQFDSLLGALKGLHSGHGHSKDIGGIGPDDSDFEEALSEDGSQEEEEEDDFDFEDDYRDEKLNFSSLKAKAADKRKTRHADDILREELEDLMPLWRSGAIGNGDGADRRFKSRAKGYDMYDSDEGFMASSSSGGRKRNKNKKEPHGGSFDTLMDINRSIEDFVKDRMSDSLQLPPMPKALRRRVHLLCNHYNLRSQSVGSGKRRFPILIKTDRTRMPLNPVNVNGLLNQSEKELTLLSAQFHGHRGKGTGGEGPGGFGGGKKKGKGGGSAMPMAAHGTVVGAQATALSVENLGHRMLSKMGWSPGVGLGATGEGIIQPIEAVMRAKRRGLGHE